MATENQKPKERLENVRNQLSLAVRSIQWSYTIFWSISPTQQGVLKWGQGYYNGDIKTRKMVQAAELKADEVGLQRSDQLRELYESLSLGETNTHAKKPTAALSPEDLTDAEWYFLICMSFVFNIGQGLPGRTLAKNQMLWLCYAHSTDTKVFSRSLLAKSASIQTVVCFPHLGGVVELGTTELVQEDPNLVQHIKTSFLDSPAANVPKILNHVSNSIANKNLIHEVLDRANMPEKEISQFLDCQDVDICSPETSSGDFADNLLIDESNLVEGLNGGVSQIQCLPSMGDTISNCLNNSTNSSDCISPTYENFHISNGSKVSDDYTHDAQESNQQKQKEGFSNDHICYQSVVSNLLKSSHQLILGPNYRNGNRESSFVSWKREGLANEPKMRTPQRLLKKVLFEVARMHENSRLESGKQNGKRDSISKQEQETDEVDRNHVLSERKRREKINERFTILGKLIPSGGKVDKVSVLDHTIEYLRKLERKIEELQFEKESQTKHHDAIEMTSDNYGHNIVGDIKKPLTNKRKACETYRKRVENSRIRSKDSSKDNITINIRDKGVLIAMCCSWRESLMLEVLEAMRKLPLFAESVQSSNPDGNLSITIEAKAKGSKVPSATMIRQALQKVVRIS